MTEPTAPVEVRPFVLEFVSTFNEVERAIRARRRATRVVYTEWTFGGFFAAVGLLLIWAGTHGTNLSRSSSSGCHVIHGIPAAVECDANRGMAG